MMMIMGSLRVLKCCNAAAAEYLYLGARCPDGGCLIRVSGGVDERRAVVGEFVLELMVCLITDRALQPVTKR